MAYSSPSNLPAKENHTRLKLNRLLGREPEIRSREYAGHPASHVLNLSSWQPQRPLLGRCELRQRGVALGLLLQGGRQAGRVMLVVVERPLRSPRRAVRDCLGQAHEGGRNVPVRLADNSAPALKQLQRLLGHGLQRRVVLVSHVISTVNYRACARSCSDIWTMDRCTRRPRPCRADMGSFRCTSARRRPARTSASRGLSRVLACLSRSRQSHRLLFLGSELRQRRSQQLLALLFDDVAEIALR